MLAIKKIRPAGHHKNAGKALIVTPTCEDIIDWILDTVPTASANAGLSRRIAQVECSLVEISAASVQSSILIDHLTLLTFGAKSIKSLGNLTSSKQAKHPLPLSSAEEFPMGAKISRGRWRFAAWLVILGKSSAAHHEDCLLLL